MAEQAAPPIPRQAIVTALVLIAGGMAVIFDSTIVGIALHTLAADLQVPVSTCCALPSRPGAAPAARQVPSPAGAPGPSAVRSTA